MAEPLAKHPRCFSFLPQVGTLQVLPLQVLPFKMSLGLLKK